ncbi:precorrin-3B synthase [Streptomyces stramineus]|uniref:Precorrin-3B synthase n=1 Tax=Streptomyces stramineus TaxID=173861 RepID=A0ABN1AC25_9ACTN
MLAAMSVTPSSPSDREETTAAGRAPRVRGDACPGALRLHAADDGALARVRVPAGLLTTRQALVLAELAEELGDGNLDLTSRGNVQLRGLAGGCGGALGERLREAGLLPSDRHERVRNVAASPLCGLDGAGHGDVQGWARELDGLLCANPEVTELSGRFLFGLDDGRGDIAALAPDVTLIAVGGGRAVLCYAAASPGLRIAAADGPRAAVLAAEWFLAERRAHGATAWRVRELPVEHRPRVDALGRRLAAAGIAAEPAAVALPSGAPVEPGLVDGPGGTTALSVGAPLGRLTSAQWRLLARTAVAYGSGELRVTPWRGIVVPGRPAGEPSGPGAPARLAALAAAGLVASAASPWHRAGACAGRPGCAKSLADVRADAAACLVADPGHRGPAGLPVYWSGCERRCGRPGGSWVDVLATADGYEVTVRAPAAGTTARAASAAELAGAVAAARSAPAPARASTA